MLEELLSDDLTVIGILALVVAVLIYIILDKNGALFNFEDEFANVKKPTNELIPNTSTALKTIFYQYNHKSEREWTEWMRQQAVGVKSTALKLLNDHLESPAKHWGPVTEEAIGTMPIFKDQGAENVLSKFLLRCSKLWGEYKSIPSLYKRTARVLAIMSPQTAVKVFNDEFSRKSNIQSELERKKIIIDALPKLDQLGIGLITDIIIDQLEIFQIRMHALRAIPQFENSNYKRILLEIMKTQIKRFSNLNREIETNEKEICEDIFKAAAQEIADKEFAAAFKFACEAQSTIHSLALAPLIKRAVTEKEKLSISELYAMTLVKDDTSNSLRTAIAKIHGLETDEIESICIAKLRDDPITEELLINETPSSTTTPIPRPYYSEFDKFTKAFGSTNMAGQSNCQKPFGGVLVTGDNELEKLYFARAFADEKGLNFGHINIASINNKEDYSRISTIFTELRKPYLLYIDHPELMYPSTKSQAASYRSKFAQTLYIQALDTKSYLVGSIKQKAKDIQSETTLMAIQELRANFFAQVFEINAKATSFKSEILDDYFSSIAPNRISSRPELGHALLEKYKNKIPLEYCFAILSNLTIMLLAYGRSVSVEEVERLRARFTIQLKGKLENVSAASLAQE